MSEPRGPRAPSRGGGGGGDFLARLKRLHYGLLVVNPLIMETPPGTAPPCGGDTEALPHWAGSLQATRAPPVTPPPRLAVPQAVLGQGPQSSRPLLTQLSTERLVQKGELRHRVLKPLA